MFKKYLLKYLNNFENLSLRDRAKVTQEGFERMGKRMFVSERHVRLPATLFFQPICALKMLRKAPDCRKSKFQLGLSCASEKTFQAWGSRSSGLRELTPYAHSKDRIYIKAFTLFSIL